MMASTYCLRNLLSSRLSRAESGSDLRFRTGAPEVAWALVQARHFSSNTPLHSASFFSRVRSSGVKRNEASGPSNSCKVESESAIWQVKPFPGMKCSELAFETVPQQSLHRVEAAGKFVHAPSSRTPARTPAIHASIARAVAHHYSAAIRATGRIVFVDDTGGVGLGRAHRVFGRSTGGGGELRR
jgi:hypothetical protein